MPCAKGGAPLALLVYCFLINWIITLSAASSSSNYSATDTTTVLLLSSSSPPPPPIVSDSIADVGSTESSTRSGVSLNTTSTAVEVPADQHNNNNTTTTTSSNETTTQRGKDDIKPAGHDFFKSSDAVIRAIYVACGILLIIIIYVFVRIRTKNKKTKWRKYGLLTNSEVEMTPLDQGEDDEEATMFDARTFRNDYK